jgi:hypothetical protein
LPYARRQRDKGLFSNSNPESTVLHAESSSKIDDAAMIERNPAADEQSCRSGPARLGADISAIVQRAEDAIREQLDRKLEDPEPEHDRERALPQRLLDHEGGAAPHDARAPAHALTAIDTGAAFDHDLRMDERDKISVTALPPLRIRLPRLPSKMGATAMIFAVGCIVGSGVTYVFGISPGSNKMSPKPGSAGDSVAVESRPIRAAVTEASRQPPPNNATAAKDATNLKPEAAQLPEWKQSANRSIGPARRTASAVQQSATVSDSAPVTARGAKTGSSPAAAFPETKPVTVEGWTVRNVVGGTATLEGPNGSFRVKRGDTVPGLGVVDSVVMWGNRWIVSTSRGLVSTP